MSVEGPGELQECGTGSEYGSGSEETSALLSRPSSHVQPLVVAMPPQVVLGGSSSSGSGPSTSAAGSGPSTSGKPVLQRQDRATYLVASPQLSVSGLGGSEESSTGIEIDPATRSVPDIELHCRLDDQQLHQPVQSTAPTIYQVGHYRQRQSSHPYRCRCDRRDSLAPSSALHLARSVSR